MASNETSFISDNYSNEQLFTNNENSTSANSVLNNYPYDFTHINERYKIVETLSRGSFAQLYKVEDTEQNKT